MEKMMDECLVGGCQEEACGAAKCKERCYLLTVKPHPSSMYPVRPRNSAGVATMARLMQRTRDERDFGGVVDE